MSYDEDIVYRADGSVGDAAMAQYILEKVSKFEMLVGEELKHQRHAKAERDEAERLKRVTTAVRDF